MADTDLKKAQPDWQEWVNEKFKEVVNVQIGEFDHCLTGINGFDASAVETQHITFTTKDGKTMHLLMMTGNLQVPAIQKSEKRDAMVVPYHVNNGVLFSAYPILGGSELCRIQVAQTQESGITRINFDNASSIDLDAYTALISCALLWTK